MKTRLTISIISLALLPPAGLFFSGKEWKQLCPCVPARPARTARLMWLARLWLLAGTIVRPVAVKRD